MILEDNSPMPFGKYKGDKMENVPPEYLIYLYNQGMNKGNVKTYIIENLEVLYKELREQGKEHLI